MESKKVTNAREKYRTNTLFHFRSIGSGIYNDIKHHLLPYYWSDIKDGLTYRTIPATVYIFFTNLLPAIAFAQDLFDHTKNSYGVNEVLLSSAMGGIVFGVFSGSPLCIVGVTGPISIFNYTVYELVVPRGTPYFQFMAWICIWSMIMHFILALGSFVNWMRYVTRFSCDVFGFFINIVYIHKGIEILVRQFELSGSEGGFASVMLALVMGIFGICATFFGNKSHYLPKKVRFFVRDYSTPLSVVFFSAFIHFGGKLDSSMFSKLPITRSFHPTDTINRGPNWFIYFWKDISVADIFLAIPFAILLTILFYYDHNISSLICHASEYPLKKPVAFHYDFFLLGITTGLSGILGLPPPNGLIPQAPLHTRALCVMDSNNQITHVVEQRLSNTIQGLMTIVMMTRPFLVVLGQIPQAVLAGLFWVMAIPTLDGTEIVQRLRFLASDPEWNEQWRSKVIDKIKEQAPLEFQEETSLETRSENKYKKTKNDDVKYIYAKAYAETILPHDEYNINDEIPFPISYYLIPKKYFVIHLVLLLLAFTAEYSITCTRAAIGFPGVLMGILIFVHLTFKRIFGTWLDLVDGGVVSGNIAKGLWLSIDGHDE